MSYIASTSLPSYWGPSASVLGNAPSHLPSTSLNFLAAIASTDLKHTTVAGTAGLQLQSAGTGGFATIEIDRSAGVAVKHSKILSQPFGMQDEDAFHEHFNQLVLELRILSHQRLRKHANIVNLIGLLTTEYSDRPSLSLILEYSAFGTIASFLGNCTETPPIVERVDFIMQISRGLEALHELEICHGDVKTQNTLVFQDGEKWILKISDFGQSVVATHDDFATRAVRCPRGTRLLNAPEIRNSTATNNVLFDIDAALSTDTFSFGLLAWEVLKNGKTFIEANWIKDRGNDTDVEAIEDFLNSLPMNGLRDIGLNFLENMCLDKKVEKHLSMVFEGALHDNPAQRRSMPCLAKILDLSLEIEESDREESSLSITAPALSSWSTQQSLYEVYDSCFENGLLIDELPISLQRRILSEIKLLANCEAVADDIRAHAAMTVSECYTLAFGTTHDSKEVANWLLRAATFGSLKAASWYHRICHATGIEPMHSGSTSSSQTLGNDLSLVATECYLIMRIHRFAASIMQQARDIMALDRITSDPQADLTYRVGIFNTSEIDELLSLHLAAWTGDDARLTTLIQHTSVDVMSASGFSAIHYACFGGHLSTLKILLSHNISVSTTGLHGITPLHLSIFFANDNLRQALDLLLYHGARSDAKTGSVIWEDHDITLSGTPLDWAVRTRNRNLVHYLLPVVPGLGCLSIAISHFFWEIVEDLLQHFQNEGRFVEKSQYLSQIRRPFSHWIAHGETYLAAIDRTIQVCQKYHIIDIAADGNTDLMHCIMSPRTEMDFRLVEAILEVSSSLFVKQKTDELWSALIYAIPVAKGDKKWLKILKKLIEFYSVEELEQLAIFEYAYLHWAVVTGSVFAARILLERGVNVNQLTFDTLQMTPLHICMDRAESTSMFSLLMEFGADPQIEDAITGSTPFQVRLAGLQRSFDLLDMASDKIIPGPIDGETMHTMLYTSMGLKRMDRTDSREVFRYLLASKNAYKYVDAVDRSGVNLIQRAAQYLHIDSVRLLLEAGADASIPLDTGAGQVVSLQIACYIGKLFWLSRASGWSQNLYKNGEMAMGVATELLHWHQAREDEQFSGISDLHLASYMASPIEVQKCLANGSDPEAKGRWPSIDHEVTPRELMEADPESELDVLESLTPGASENSEGSQDPHRSVMRFDAMSISATCDQIRASLRGSRGSSRKVEVV